MTKSVVAMAAMLAATIGYAGDSAPMVIDLRDEPLVDNIVISWNASWIGGDTNATVVIADNGVEIKCTTGTGEFEHLLSGPCRHELTYTTYVDGIAQDEVYAVTVYKDWKYEVRDGGAVIVDTVHKADDVAVPLEIDGYPVIGPWAETTISFGDTYRYHNTDWDNGGYLERDLKKSNYVRVFADGADNHTHVALLEVLGASSKEMINPVVENLGFKGTLTASVWTDEELRNAVLPPLSTAGEWESGGCSIDDRDPDDISGPCNFSHYPDSVYEYESDDGEFNWPQDLWPDNKAVAGRFWVSVECKASEVGRWGGIDGGFRVWQSGTGVKSEQMYVTYKTEGSWPCITNLPSLFRGLPLTNSDRYGFDIDIWDVIHIAYGVPLHSFWLESAPERPGAPLEITLPEAGILYMTAYEGDLEEIDVENADSVERKSISWNQYAAMGGEQYFYEYSSDYNNRSVLAAKVNSGRTIRLVQEDEFEDYDFNRFQFFPSSSKAVAVEASFVSIFDKNRYPRQSGNNVGDYLQGYVTGTGVYKVGETVAVTAVPAPGEAFDHWELKYGNFPSGIDTTNPTLSFVVTDACAGTAEERKQMVVKAVWKAKHQMVATSSDITKGHATGSGFYHAGDSVTLTAVPESGYEFVEWSDGVKTTSRTVNVTGDAEYVAKFQVSGGEPSGISLGDPYCYVDWVYAGEGNGALWSRDHWDWQDVWADSEDWAVVPINGATESDSLTPVVVYGSADASMVSDVHIEDEATFKARFKLNIEYNLRHNHTDPGSITRFVASRKWLMAKISYKSEAFAPKTFFIGLKGGNEYRKFVVVKKYSEGAIEDGYDNASESIALPLPVGSATVSNNGVGARTVTIVPNAGMKVAGWSDNPAKTSTERSLQPSATPYFVNIESAGPAGISLGDPYCWATNMSGWCNLHNGSSRVSCWADGEDSAVVPIIGATDSDELVPVIVYGSADASMIFDIRIEDEATFKARIDSAKYMEWEVEPTSRTEPNDIKSFIASRKWLVAKINYKAESFAPKTFFLGLKGGSEYRKFIIVWKDSEGANEDGYDENGETIVLPLPVGSATVSNNGAGARTVTVVPNAGMKVAGWSDDGSNASAERSLAPSKEPYFVNIALAGGESDPVLFTVTFDLNGADGDAPAPKRVTEGSAVGTLPEPTRTGYSFKGWFTAADGGEQIAAETVVSGDVTYYAQWTINQYTVTFDANGGTGGRTTTQDYGSAIVPPTVKFEDYTFMGWLPEVAATVPASNVTYTAQWTVNGYSIVYNPNGGIGIMNSTAATYNSVTNLAANGFTRTGYAFAGWALTPDGEATLLDGDSTADIVADDGETVMLYAVWREGAGGGKGLSVKYYDISPSGYNIWRQSEVAMTNYFAGFTPTIIANTIDFGSRLSSGMAGYEDQRSQMLSAGMTGLDDEVDCRFHGKYADESCNNFSVLLDGKLTVDTSGEYAFAVLADDKLCLYIDGRQVCCAIWSSVAQGRLSLESGAHRITMAFHEDSGRQGFNVQWKKPGDTSYSPLPQSVLSNERNIAAYAIRFDANGGVGSLPKRVYAMGGDVTVPDGVFSREGWTLVGWATEPNGPAIYAAQGMIDGGIAAADGQTVTLYAQWTISQYMVTFDLNVADGLAPERRLMTKGDAIGEMPTPTRTGYTFAGWWTAADGGERISESTVVAGTITCYAHWKLMSLGDYLGCPAQEFTTGGDAEWTRATGVSADGYALRSGEIGNKKSSILETVVTNAGQISFMCKVSSEADEEDGEVYDGLSFWVDGVCRTAELIGGEVDWRSLTFEVEGDGAHILSWKYSKDKSGSAGEDCAWLDEVVWTPAAIDPIPAVAVDAAPEAVTNAIEAAGFADAAAIKEAVGGEGAATKYAAFKAWAGSVKGAAGSVGAASAAGEAAVVANTNAAAAWLLGAERLFENAPKIEFGEVAVATSATLPGGGNTGAGGAMGSSRPTMTVSVVVKDGEEAVKCAAEKVKEMFEATSDLRDWGSGAMGSSRPTMPIAVTVEEGEGGTMRFKVTPGDGTAPRAFLRIRK